MERVEKLLSTGSSPKAVDSAGYTPLVRALPLAVSCHQLIFSDVIMMSISV